MAIETKCQTPGATFVTHVTPTAIKVEVWWNPLLMNLDLTEEEAELLEANIHNALELVLAPHFKGN